VTDINGRLAEILAEYATTMADLEPKEPAPPRDQAGHPILRPADEQRACRPPTIAPNA
jgi:hypothetical protein